MKTKPQKAASADPISKTEGRRTASDRLNEKHSLRARKAGKPRSAEDEAHAVARQEKAVADELRRLLNKENPKINGRRGRRPYTRGAKPVRRRINVRRRS